MNKVLGCRNTLYKNELFPSDKLHHYQFAELYTYFYKNSESLINIFNHLMKWKQKSLVFGEFMKNIFLLINLNCEAII